MKFPDLWNEDMTVKHVLIPWNMKSTWVRLQHLKEPSMLRSSSVHLDLNTGSDPRTWRWCSTSAGFQCFMRLWKSSAALRQWQLLSACRISYSLSLVLLSVNQSSDKERATAAAHTPGAKKEKKERERFSQAACLPLLCPSSDYNPHPSLQNPLLSLSQRPCRDEREYAMRRLWLWTERCY